MRRFLLTVEGTDYQVEVSRDKVTVDGRPFQVEVAGDKVTVDGTEYGIELDQGTAWVNGFPYHFAYVQQVAVSMERIAIHSTRHEVRNMHPVSATHHPPPSAGSAHTVSAVMPGKVLRVLVKEGQVLQAGDVVCILEAMKMENELHAPQAGTVQQVLVKPGQDVEAGEPLVILG